MGRGGKNLLCDPGSELRLGGRENRRATIINGEAGGQFLDAHTYVFRTHAKKVGIPWVWARNLHSETEPTKKSNKACMSTIDLCMSHLFDC